ncbi:iron-containing alcohol dehydrogenase [Microvirga sp. 2YAF29]|uniref:iron-containing alcohol dehydrogenase n=1 Tax=Microvirga sp. 2YAF29 TaxID=3233031 RepID=UPI003F997620
MSSFTFNTVPSLIAGPGCIAQLGEVAAQRLGARVALVTDAGLVKTGLVARALTILEEAGIAVDVFDGVVADPPEDVVLAAVAKAKAFDARAVIGFGGGSSIDVAKLVALLVRSGEDLPEIYGVGEAKGPRLPLLAIPTTAGTGSEVTPISIVTTGAHEKKGVVSPLLIPDIALLDPDLTVNLPPHVTAATGIDAMVHAIEAYTSVSANNNPVSKALAREALRLLGRNIERAVHHGADKEARAAMLLGSMLAGQAFANSPVAAVHALAYPIGGHFGVPHGLSNALVLPHVLRFNASACEDTYAELAPYVFPDREGKVSAAAFAEAIAGLCGRVGLQPRLRDVGIPQDALPMLAEDAMKQTRLLVNNPRPVTLQDARAIYEAAW